MALFVRQDDNRSEIQKRVAAELQAKAVAKAKEAELPDGVTDSQYIKGTKHTSSLAWIWILIFAFVLIGLIVFIITSSL